MRVGRAHAMLSRSEASLVRRLRRRRVREREGLFLAEGVRVVEDLLESGLRVRKAVVESGFGGNERERALLTALKREVAEVAVVASKRFGELAATETAQGVLAVVEAPRSGLGAVRIDGAATVLVLDGVQDPGNFGTLVRTAEAFGVRAVLALSGTVDAWNPKAVRAAAGASFRVPMARPAAQEAIEWLHRRGFALWGAEASGRPIEEVERPERVALAVGNEGAGLGPELGRALDGTVAVPIRGGAESLNVAVAAGILLYCLSREG